MKVVGRAMQAMSQVDAEIRKEASALPEGFSFQMTVLPSGPNVVMKAASGGRLGYQGAGDGCKPDLSIIFKHLVHAHMVFTFEESTTQSLANDRMIIDGDVPSAMKVVRILNRLECYILPKFVAARAVKRYPKIGLGDKVTRGARIYLQMAFDLVRGQ